MQHNNREDDLFHLLFGDGVHIIPISENKEQGEVAIKPSLTLGGILQNLKEAATEAIMEAKAETLGDILDAAIKAKEAEQSAPQMNPYTAAVLTLLSAVETAGKMNEGRGPNGADILREAGLKIIHFFNTSNNKGGLTVVYKTVVSTMEVATAVCHPKDSYDRKVGLHKAVENYLDGRFITLPVLPHHTPEQTLMQYFSYTAYRTA